MENSQYIQEDEVDLREYIKVIIKRKKLILAIFLVSVVAAAIVSLRTRTPKVYEITSIVQLGSDSGPLVNKEEAREIILNQNTLASVIKELGLETGPETLKKNIQIEDIPNTNLLRIAIKLDEVDKAIRINDAIVAPFISQGQRIYQERAEIINERLKELNAAVKSAEEDIKRTQDLIRDILNAKDISQSEVFLGIIVLQNTLSESKNNLSNLRNQMDSLQVSLVNSKDFKIFQSPVAYEYPAARNKKKNIIIYGIFGLILGIFSAFFVEFLQRPKMINKQ